jgi:hypothetical protein
MTLMQKIKVHLEVYDDAKYSVSNGYNEELIDGYKVYTIDHDPKSITNIRVNLISGKIIIKKIVCNDIHLVLLDKFGVYKTHDSVVLHNRYGYMDIAGTYTFKIRYSVKVFHHMLYMLEKFAL